MLTRQAGATLLEAMIALFLVAFGVLAMAGMQIRTLNETRNSAARNTAAQMTSDLLDRILANNVAVAQGNSTSPYRTSWGTPATPAVDCRTAVCNSQQLAQFDLWQWKTALAEQLPEGDGQVFVSTTDTAQLGVLLRWRRIMARQESTSSTATQQLFVNADEVKDGLGNSGTGVASIACSTGYICHLTYLRP